MPVVKGREKIQQTIEEMLADAKNKLMQRMASSEAKFLFVILESMSYYFGSTLISRMRGDYAYLDLDSFRAVQCLKALLDAVIETGFVRVQACESHEFTEILEALPQYFDIAYYSRLLKIQLNWGSDVALIEQGKITDLNGDEFYGAIRPWVNSASSDPDWMNWYFAHYPAHRNQAYQTLRSEFLKKGGLDLNDLTAISDHLENVCKGHVEKVGAAHHSTKRWPLLWIKMKRLRRIFAKHMDEARASRWLRELQYKPGQSIYKRPLIRLKKCGKDIVVIPFWVFYPSNWFWGSRITTVMDESRRSAAWGTWSRGYGLAFEKYLDDVLKHEVPNVINMGKRRFNVAEYPEIQACSGMQRKTEFEVDRVLAKDGVVFVVSCKARDFLFDNKLLLRDLFFPAEEIERRVDANIEHLNEVSYEAKCLESNSRISLSMGLRSTKVIPVVVTSHPEPLSVSGVRDYFLRIRNFPDVQMLTVSAFAKFLEGAF